MNAVDTNSASLSASRPLGARFEDPNRISFAVGGISFGVSAFGGMRLELEPGMVPFSVSPESCDCEFSAEFIDQLEMPAASPMFHSGGLWAAYQERSGTSLFFSTSYLGASPYKKCWFSGDRTHGKIWLQRRYFDPQKAVYPLEYPLDELLMIHRLGLGDGVEIHGCGVVSGDRAGRLFVGHSGAGKSTAASLWQRETGTMVLSDDRIIVRRRGDSYAMYGTPWHGDAGLAQQAWAPLQSIYLLEQSPVNEVVAVPRTRATAELFTRTFVPHYDRAGIARALEFLTKLSAAIPVRILRCTPDVRAIQEVLRAA